MTGKLNQRLVFERQAKTPFSKLINNAIRNKLMDIHTCMPGVVVAFYESDFTADIQPLFKTQYSDGTILTLPVIPRVPIRFPGSALGWARWPLAVGDPVELRFFERASGQWYSTGSQAGPQLPEDGRIFDLIDAIATPGLRDAKNPIIPQGSTSSAEFVFKNARIEITIDSKVKIANGTMSLTQALDDLGSALTNAVVVPSGPAYVFNPATITAIQNAINEINSILG